VREFRSSGLRLKSQRENFLPRNLRLRKIELVNSEVNIDKLRRMIRRLLNLEIFVYKIWSCHPLWRPEKLVDALRQYANNLTDLSLTIGESLCLLIVVDFQEFVRLRRLRLSSILLERRRPTRQKRERLVRAGVTADESNNAGLTLPRMIDILPPSIEHFTLVGSIDSKAMEVLLNGLIATKKQCLPDLDENPIREPSGLCHEIAVLASEQSSAFRTWEQCSRSLYKLSRRLAR